MVAHQVLIEVVPLKLTTHAPVLRVTRRDEFPAALAQRTKTVVIDNAEIEHSLSSIERWRTVRFLGVGVLVAAVISLAIAQRYKIDFSWTLNWKIERLEGKITLTPHSN
jgi:hypothetical protein